MPKPDPGIAEAALKKAAKRAFICGFIIGRTDREGPQGLAAEDAFDRWWYEVGRARTLEAAGVTET